jgi:hypothetical protein
MKALVISDVKLFMSFGYFKVLTRQVFTTETVILRRSQIPRFQTKTKHSPTCYKHRNMHLISMALDMSHLLIIYDIDSKLQHSNASCKLYISCSPAVQRVRQLFQMKPNHPQTTACFLASTSRSALE